MQYAKRMNHFCNPESNILTIVKPMGITYAASVAIEKSNPKKHLWYILIVLTSRLAA
jgi:hypothetical protein